MSDNDTLIEQARRSRALYGTTNRGSGRTIHDLCYDLADALAASEQRIARTRIGDEHLN
jgi:hypothetical protein